MVRPDATPVPHALVAVARGTGPTPEMAIRADAAGRFRLALPAGRYRIEARDADGGTGSVAVVVRGEAIAFEIAIPRPPADLRSTP